MGSSGRRKILIATTNPGKIREIRGILADAPVELVTLADLPAIPSPRKTARRSPTTPG